MIDISIHPYLVNLLLGRIHLLPDEKEWSAYEISVRRKSELGRKIVYVVEDEIEVIVDYPKGQITISPGFNPDMEHVYLKFYTVWDLVRRTGIQAWLDGRHCATPWDFIAAAKLLIPYVKADTITLCTTPPNRWAINPHIAEMPNWISGAEFELAQICRFPMLRTFLLSIMHESDQHSWLSNALYAAATNNNYTSFRIDQEHVIDYIFMPNLPRQPSVYTWSMKGVCNSISWFKFFDGHVMLYNESSARIAHVLQRFLEADLTEFVADRENISVPFRRAFNLRVLNLYNLWPYSELPPYGLHSAGMLTSVALTMVKTFPFYISLKMPDEEFVRRLKLGIVLCLLDQIAITFYAPSIYQLLINMGYWLLALFGRRPAREIKGIYLDLNQMHNKYGLSKPLLYWIALACAYPEDHNNRIQDPRLFELLDHPEVIKMFRTLETIIPDDIRKLVECHGKNLAAF